MKHTAARLAQLEKRRSAEREVASSNPGRTINQGLKKNWWDHASSVQMIASMGSDIKPLALSPSSL